MITFLRVKFYPQDMHFFAYGTLMDPETMTRVSRSRYRSQQATLPDNVRKLVRGEVYPAILEQAGGSVDGVVYYNVSSESFDRLDKFEGPLYARTRVVTICDNDKSVAAYTYVITANYAFRLSTDDWSYENFLQNPQQNFHR